MKKYEIIEHTADVGLRIRAGDLRLLFENAATGMFDLITDFKAFKNQKCDRTVKFKLEAEDLPDLFLKWLREILYNFSAKRVILVSYHFKRLTETRAEVEAEGVPYDPEKHVQKYEIKAVTYHDFKLEHEKGGYIAEVIFDI